MIGLVLYPAFLFFVVQKTLALPTQVASSVTSEPRSPGFDSCSFQTYFRTTCSLKLALYQCTH